MSVEATTRLAQQQAALVAALAGGGPAPPGFGPARLRITAESLARKRARAAARAWPGLADALAGEFAAQFASYAAQTPLPAQGGPLADGRGFARWLAARHELPASGVLEALAVDLHFVTSPQGLRPRRGPALKFTRLQQLRRLVVAVRFPWLGDFWLTIPLGRAAKVG